MFEFFRILFSHFKLTLYKLFHLESNFLETTITESMTSKLPICYFAITTGAYPRGGGAFGACAPPLSLMPNEKIYGD